MEAGDSVAEDSPRYVLDAELVSNIGGAVAFLKSGFQSEDLSFFGKDQIPFGEAPETGVGFSDMIVLADKLKVTLDNTKASV
ncbi:MAG: hypothetical protein PHX10_08205 [Gallionellaceae bacterium]|nr:hypothetical protein [Gallionellaceae bacterium]